MVNVTSGGTGANCKKSAPCGDPATAIALATGRSDNGKNVTIEVAAGTYEEGATLTIDASSLTSLTLQGAGASMTTIEPSITAEVLDLTGGTVTIAGVTITGGTGTSFETSAAGGVWIQDTDPVLLEDDSISGNTYSGTSIGAGGVVAESSSTTLENDTLSNNIGDSESYPEPSASYGPSSLINDTFTGNSDAADVIYNAGGSLENITVGGNSSLIAALYIPRATISNSIIDDSPACLPTEFVDGGYNVVDDDTCLFYLGSTSIEGNSSIDLGPLAPNGSAGPWDHDHRPG
jgi:hypothetical protein